MFNWTILLAAVMAAMTASSSVAEDVFEFVGFSTETVVGDVFFTGMHAACQADFGLNSRICTTPEYALSPNATVPIVPSWVQPVPGVQGDVISRRSADNCVGWANLGGTA